MQRSVNLATSLVRLRERHSSGPQTSGVVPNPASPVQWEPEVRDARVVRVGVGAWMSAAPANWPHGDVVQRMIEGVRGRHGRLPLSPARAVHGDDRYLRTQLRD